MKKLSLLLIGLLIFSCSDDEEGNPEGSRLWDIILNETMTSDAASVYKTETFSFDRSQLIQRRISQKVLESEINYEADLSYSENKVTVATEGITLTYELNDKGYAAACTYSTAGQNREYTFSYSPEGYLTQIDENIGNRHYSATVLAYEDGDLISVTSSLNGVSNTIHYSPSEESSPFYMPCLTLLDTYPFTLHVEALYAGLLGKAPRHLTARTRPEGNDNEYTAYTYRFDTKGNLVQIDSRTTGDGKDDYPYSYPCWRKLSIAIQ